ncbi:hypothetical protein ACQVA2_08200 [Citrobacter sp. OP27]
MTTYNTGNPLGSSAAKDLYDNAQNFDFALNSITQAIWNDRFGHERRSWFGLESMVATAASAYGYIILNGKSFTTGATVQLNEILLDEETGEYFKWTGSFPDGGLVVPPNSSPEGSEGPGAWLSVGDSAFRSDLSQATGASLVGTNHRGTLQQDLDVIDIRTSGQDISTLLAAGSDVEIDTTISSALSVASTKNISGRDDGKVIVAKGTYGLVSTSSSSSISNLNVEGDGSVSTTDTVVTGNIKIEADDTTVSASKLSKTMIGFYVKGNRAKLIGNKTDSMVISSAQGVGGGGAGGYGILCEGVTDLLVAGHSAVATSENDRHFAYLSNTTGGGAANRDIRLIGNRAEWSAVNAGSNDLTRSTVMVNIRGNSGVIVLGNQLRGAGSGIGITNELVDVEYINITGNQLLGITKAAPDDACVGIGISGVNGKPEIPGFNISDNHIQLSRKAGVTDGARVPYPIYITRGRHGVISGNVIASPGSSAAIYLVESRDIAISNISGLSNDGSQVEGFIRFATGCRNISVSNVQHDRATMFSGLDAVTDLTVDFPRICEVYYNAGVLSTVDPYGLIGTVAISGNNVVVTMKAHVTQAACDSSQTRPMFSAAPINLITGSASKVLTIAAFTGANTAVSPSTGQVRFKLIFNC